MRPRTPALVVALLLLAAACGPDAATATAPTPPGASTTTDVAAPPAAGPPPTTPQPTEPPTTTTTVPPLAPTGAGALTGATVVVDPGHNGANFLYPEETARPVDAGGYPSESCNTTGTSSADGFTESAFNWDVAGLLVDELRARGATVVLTRSSDDGWGPCIDQRGKVAWQNGAAALVSIHADGNDPAASGYHVIRPGLVPGYTDDVVAPSRALATEVSDRLAAAGFVPADYVRGAPVVERADLATLNNARVPAVMVEAGNLRNPEEAARLRDPVVQQALALALADAIAAFVAAGGSG